MTTTRKQSKKSAVNPTAKKETTKRATKSAAAPSAPQPPRNTGNTNNSDAEFADSLLRAVAIINSPDERYKSAFNSNKDFAAAVIAETKKLTADSGAHAVAVAIASGDASSAIKLACALGHPGYGLPLELAWARSDKRNRVYPKVYAMKRCHNTSVIKSCHNPE